MPAASADGSPGLPTLVFVRRRQCGACRKMESLVAWIKVTKKRHLRVVSIDADRQPDVAQQLHVSHVPSLVLVKDGHIVGNLEGRSTGRQIDELIREHVDDPT